MPKKVWKHTFYFTKAHLKQFDLNAIGDLCGHPILEYQNGMESIFLIYSKIFMNFLTECSDCFRYSSSKLVQASS